MLLPKPAVAPALVARGDSWRVRLLSSFGCLRAKNAIITEKPSRFERRGQRHRQIRNGLPNSIEISSEQTFRRNTNVRTSSNKHKYRRDGGPVIINWASRGVEIPRYYRSVSFSFNVTGGYLNGEFNKMVKRPRCHTVDLSWRRWEYRYGIRMQRHF